MRQFLVTLGHIQSVIFITFFSCFASVLITLLFVYLFAQYGIPVDVNSHVIIAFLVPLFLAPPISWVILGLLLKIDQFEVQMRQAAMFDSLTGLFNRQPFMARSSYVSDLAAREGFGLSVLLVDLDHFKLINDKYGHANGDRVLSAFGNTVRQIVRSSDIAGRLGGEEFAFLLPNTSQDQAWIFSERLHEAVRQTVIEYDSQTIQITMSIGIASLPQGARSDIETLLRRADMAMYRAKQNGRNQSAHCNQSCATMNETIAVS